MCIFTLKWIFSCSLDIIKSETLRGFRNLLIQPHPLTGAESYLNVFKNWLCPGHCYSGLGNTVNQSFIFFLLQTKSDLREDSIAGRKECGSVRPPVERVCSVGVRCVLFLGNIVTLTNTNVHIPVLCVIIHVRTPSWFSSLNWSLFLPKSEMFLFWLFETGFSWVDLAVLKQTL